MCPAQLKGGLFTTAAIDNIDHNPSSTTSHEQEYLYSKSSRQVERSSTDCCNYPRQRLHCDQENSSISATNEPPVAMHKAIPPKPKLEGPNKSDCQFILQTMMKEYRYIINSCVYHASTMFTMLAPSTIKRITRRHRGTHFSIAPVL